ncbi:DUF1129 family protein [Ferdinandcohnia quinoae]|uniref:DUF1129 family protein n=1 Tax=Fredinandcohnia quinoae TaxID=2918902 RepID=A0AAW5DTQ8_9BACI|nr:DUF1129 family protein [Fredinandcohnia sp. SECRCQ15]MCH1624030.1 DUF1129 family protein [Fredinandcohnia sp. SECRCQ15]
MNATKLIEENNRKRELLTPENEVYYSDMLVYIRLQFLISEQQSEEVLMELLDHLLEGQEAGKTAKDIFGSNPKAYADEIIELLPKEQKRAVLPFVLGIIGNIVSWTLLLRGMIFLVVSRFHEVNIEVYPFKVIVIGLMIAMFVIFTIWVIFKLVKNSLFQKKRTTKRDMVIAGSVAALNMAAVLTAVRFIPDIGPSFNFTWWASLLAGGILWIILYVIKKK